MAQTGIWECKIGNAPDEWVGHSGGAGHDRDMRKAVEEAFIRITGKEPDFIFSGWGAQLDDVEQEIIDEEKEGLT